MERSRKDEGERSKTVMNEHKQMVRYTREGQTKRWRLSWREKLSRCDNKVISKDESEQNFSRLEKHTQKSPEDTHK